MLSIDLIMKHIKKINERLKIILKQKTYPIYKYKKV
jgi:hypothetical protein